MSARTDPRAANPRRMNGAPHVPDWRYYLNRQVWATAIIGRGTSPGLVEALAESACRVERFPAEGVDAEAVSDRTGPADLGACRAITIWDPSIQGPHDGRSDGRVMSHESDVVFMRPVLRQPAGER
ncbi:MAG: hypothetical protein KKA32_00865, partial [Actinobacteria bacterium]|nr:hypothetical protein [Actinomycetota bacterium]